MSDGRSADSLVLKGGMPVSYSFGRFSRVACCLALILIAIALTSCAGGRVYQDSHGYIPASITDKATWTATGDLAGPVQAIDANIATATISQAYYTGDAITIDLGKPCLFQTVILEHGQREFGFASKVEVATSPDATNFRTQFVTEGTRRVTIALLPNPVLARYVRIRAAQAGPEPWSIAELSLQ